MRLGLMDYWQATPGPDRVCLAHELAMRGIEALAPSADPRADEPGITQRAAWAQRLRVPTVAVYAPKLDVGVLSRDAKASAQRDHAACYTQLAWLAQWANRHQCKLVTVPMSGYPLPEPTRLSALLTQLVNLAETFRMQWALKIFGASRDWKPLLGHLPADRVGVCVDPGWLNRLGLEVETELRAWSKHLVHVHLPDESILGGPSVPVMPLQGVSSLHKVLDQLHYTGTVIMHSPGLIDEIATPLAITPGPGRAAA